MFFVHRTSGIAGLAIDIIIIVAVCMIVYYACKAMGYEIPQWIRNIALVLVVAYIGTRAIMFLAGMQ